MRFDKPRCPECGKLAIGTWENVPATALFEKPNDVPTWNVETQQDEPASEEESPDFEYGGETRMHWDGQTTLTDEEGRVTLCCRNGHDWQALPIDGDGRPAGESSIETGVELVVRVTLPADWEGSKPGPKRLQHILRKLLEVGQADACETVFDGEFLNADAELAACVSVSVSTKAAPAN